VRANDPNASIAPLGLLSWGEIVLLAPLGLAVAIFIDRHTPFTAGGFPWLWLIPLLLGLRYGLAAAAISSLLLVLGGTAAQQWGISEQAPPLAQIVGGLITALSAGQFRSNWRSRLEASNQVKKYAEERLEALTRAYFITRISHDRLEEAMITQPVTLRAALEQMQSVASRANRGMAGEFAADLLQLLAQYCRFETVSIHLFSEAKPDPAPLAALGPVTPLDLDDPLIRLALEEGRTAFYTVDQLRQFNSKIAYRAVFLLRDSSGKDWALLVVHDLPLLALNEENLAMATAIVHYVADEVRVRNESADLVAQFPCCPPHFAHELIKLHRLRLLAKVRSTLIMLDLSVANVQGAAPEPDAIYRGMRRSLDVYWISPKGDASPGLLILLPLAGPAGARGYLDRLDAWLTNHGYPEGLNAPFFRIKEITLGALSVEETLKAVGIECRPPPTA